MENTLQTVTDAAEVLLDALADLDAGDVAPSELGDLFCGLVGSADRLDAHLAKLATASERSGVHELDGSTSLAAWAAHEVDTQRSRVTRLVHTGRFLDDHSVFAEAACDGTISAAHVARLKRAPDTDVLKASMAQEATQVELVGYTTSHGFDDWVRVLAHWKLVVDPDGPEDRVAWGHDQRRFTLSANFDTSGFSGELELGNLDGIELRELIGRKADALFHRDLAEARQRLGRDPTAGELGRTHANRRVDALMEICRLGFAADPDITATQLPLVTIHIDYDTFSAALDWLAGHDDAYDDLDPLDMVCESLDGTPIVPTEAVEAAFRGHIRRMVFDGDSQLVDFGPTRRFFTGTLRHAVLLRDRWCQHPGCRRPARWCHIDHIHPHSRAGPTSIDNAQALCGHHNRRKADTIPTAA